MTTKLASLALLATLLSACAQEGVPGHWEAEGEPKQAHWEVVRDVALELSPCRVDYRKTGTIRFHDGVFACYPEYGPGPPYCNGMTGYHVIDVNGAENSDVTWGTLPYEFANTLAQICWYRDDEPPEMKALVLRIAEEARRRIAAMEGTP